MRAAIIVSVVLSSFGIILEAQTQPTFKPAPGSPFTVGVAPISVASGDFNGDGIPDLATANAATNNVTVLLGNGSGGFTPAPGSPFAVGTYPGFVVVGDFNKDGHLDLATAIENSNNNITVLLGNGAGGFAAAAGSPIAVGLHPQSLAVADFNGDGIQDLVSINSLSDSVTILLGTGSGGFTPATGSPFTLLSAAVSVAVGDFNKDGHLDLAMAAGQGGITILLGNGAGAFSPAPGSPYAAGLNAGSVVVADFNGDGIQDVAATNSNGSSNNVTVLLGSGGGAFKVAAGSPFAVGTIPSSVAAGDFNGDGFKDLAVTIFGSNNVTILLGNGAGGFTAATNTFAVGSNPESIVTADFNADGVPDLATANPGSGNVTVLLGGGSGTATPTISKGGIVPVYSTASTIQSGEWVSIYGTNLASSTTTWTGDFPTSLGGTIVTIDGKPAYLWVVTPGQINSQVPDDANTGPVAVVVNTSAGSATATVTLGAYAPAFLLLSAKYPTAIVQTAGPGNSGAGYDIIGPSGAFPYASRPAKAGEIVVIYAVGFGPTNPPVPAGQLYSGAAPCVTPPQITIGGVQAQVAFAGIVEAGLYQLNVIVPNLSSGDRPSSQASGARARSQISM
jgi:uncharacterized protein (TIGR03437 family)